MTLTSTQVRSWAAPWDELLTWRTVVVTPPTDLPVSVSYMCDQVLRVANDGYDSTFIEQAIRIATMAAENETGRALMPRTLKQVQSGFAAGRNVLAMLPVLEVTSFEYVDEAGDVQTLAASPAEYQLIEAGEWTRAEVHPLADTEWPATRAQGDAVRITYRAGYEREEAILDLIKGGIAVMVAELYKQRTLSVHGLSMSPAILQLPYFWRPVY